MNNNIETELIVSDLEKIIDIVKSNKVGFLKDYYNLSGILPNDGSILIKVAKWDLILVTLNKTLDTIKGINNEHYI